MSDDFLAGRAFALARDTREMAGTINEAMACLTYERQQNAIHVGHKAAMQKQIDALRQEVLDLKVELVKKTAHGAGMKAYRDEFKNAHPNSPVLADSGHRYKNGDMKPMGVLAYEATFDRIFTENRISNPERFREV